MGEMTRFIDSLYDIKAKATALLADNTTTAGEHVNARGALAKAIAEHDAYWGVEPQPIPQPVRFETIRINSVNTGNLVGQLTELLKPTQRIVAIVRLGSTGDSDTDDIIIENGR